MKRKDLIKKLKKLDVFCCGMVETTIGIITQIRKYHSQFLATKKSKNI